MELFFFFIFTREWYSWHFPELNKLIPDQLVFAKLAKFIKSKDTLSDESLDELEAITGDRNMAEQILAAANASMGTEYSVRVFGLTKIR